MAEPGDIELMERFRSGDRAALEELVNRHHGSLVRYFYMQCRQRETSEDLAQEVWARIIRHRETYTARARFQTYLFHIARNLWIDRYRSRKSAPPMISADAPAGGADGDEGTTLAALLPGSERDPAEEASLREQAERVRAAVRTLPDTLRDVFELGEIQGLAYAEVARILDIPVGTVKSRMFHAVRRLRECLGASPSGEEANDDA
jgi:RNA polymerase sigma-70 factor (ECF subfamily)